MRAIIVDDEYEIREEIKSLLKEMTGIEIVGIYENPLEALDEVEESNPEYAFLDIEMPGMNGIDLAEKLLVRNPRIEIIFITAFNHYATQAFEVNALDYVLKPIHPERFLKTVRRICENHKQVPLLMPQAAVIQSFGCFEVLAGDSLIRWNRSKAKELFAYLLHYRGQKKNKYKICEDLWPECVPKKALVNLQTSMCSLRKSLGSLGEKSLVIEFSEESYVLKLENVSWDTEEFEKLYAELKASWKDEKAQKAIALYLGDYMGSEDWKWSQLTAESLSRKYEDLLRGLAGAYYKKNILNESMELLLLLLRRQAAEKEVQLMMLDCAYRSSGVNGVSHWAQTLQNLYRNEYDIPLEPEVVAFCLEKGVIL